MRIFSGNSNPTLAASIAAYLDTGLGKMICDRFPDGEVKVQIQEDVRGNDVFFIQSTWGDLNLMELMVMADAFRRASAARITAVIPYFGYARQDRKHEGRVPITAKLVANLLTTSGIDRILTIDLHAMQIQGFFDIPLDHLKALPVQMAYLQDAELVDPVVLCPDPGSIKLADSLAKQLGAGLAIIDKRRVGDQDTRVANVIGEIEGRDVIVVDDMITTAGSMLNAVRTARERGGRKLLPMCTHAIFCGPAMERLQSAALDELIVTDTVAIDEKYQRLPLTILSVADLLGEAIRRIHTNQSVSSLIV